MLLRENGVLQMKKLERVLELIFLVNIFYQFLFVYS